MNRQSKDGGRKNKSKNQNEAFIVRNHKRIFTVGVFPESSGEILD